MSSEIPQAARFWPPQGRVIYVETVGKKCMVSWFADPEGEWMEAGALTPRSEGETDPEAESWHVPDHWFSDGRPPTPDDTEEDEEERDEVGGADSGPEGPYILDVRQARIYFRTRISDRIPECRVVLPNDFPFRSGRKGFVKDRSKSYDENGAPVPGVLLLYALKTGALEDRLRAVEGCSTEFFAKAEFYGDMFIAMDETARDVRKFTVFAGNKLAASARNSEGLSDWILWEKVADTAAFLQAERRSRAALPHDSDNQRRFLTVVKEAVIECGGLPSQDHVRKKWEKVAAGGEWRELRKTVGFEWLPSKSDWKKFREI